MQVQNTNSAAIRTIFQANGATRQTPVTPANAQPKTDYSRQEARAHDASETASTQTQHVIRTGFSREVAQKTNETSPVDGSEDGDGGAADSEGYYPHHYHHRHHHPHRQRAYHQPQRDSIDDIFAEIGIQIPTAAKVYRPDFTSMAAEAKKTEISTDANSTEDEDTQAVSPTVTAPVANSSGDEEGFGRTIQDRRQQKAAARPIATQKK